VEEDEICCAEVRFMWRCVSCFKLCTGFTLPSGTCFLCGGRLEIIPARDTADPMRFGAVQEALQFQLSLFHFYEFARQRATQPEQRMVLDYFCDTALDHLSALEEIYRAHVDWDEEKMRLEWPFQDIRVTDDSGITDLYRGAIEIERRARDHFRGLAAEGPSGLENELCKELAAEEDEHVFALEAELEQIA
jgi:rubrerythrin